jgi:hypothetical protein
VEVVVAPIVSSEPKTRSVFIIMEINPTIRTMIVVVLKAELFVVIVIVNFFLIDFFGTSGNSFLFLNTTALSDCEGNSIFNFTVQGSFLTLLY